jgi:hypothetical protein
MIHDILVLAFIFALGYVLTDIVWIIVKALSIDPKPVPPKKVSIVKPVFWTGFWTCERCTHHYFYMNLTEFETLIDRHVCKKVNA